MYQGVRIYLKENAGYKASLVVLVRKISLLDRCEYWRLILPLGPSLARGV